MTVQVDVLDKGFVRLVSYMQPDPMPEGDGPAIDPMCNGWTGDLEIVRNARVSYNADWRTGDDEGKDEKLIKFMMKHGHTSPFEAMVFTFEIKAPIFVIRQWHRHRTWSYNEVSARYTTLDEGFYYPTINSIGKQNPENKQSRDVNLDLTAEEIEIRRGFLDVLHVHCEEAQRMYELALYKGIPRELARMLLPLNAYSRYFGTVNLHNLMNVFLRERLAEGAQWEIREYAFAMLQLIEPICPITVAAFKENYFGRASSDTEGN